MLDINIRSVLNRIHEGVLCFENGKLSYVNPYMEQLTQYSKEEILDFQFLKQQGMILAEFLSAVEKADRDQEQIQVKITIFLFGVQIFGHRKEI